MDKVKISHSRKRSLKSTPKLKLRTDTGLTEYSPTDELLDENFIALAIWDCLKNNDAEGVVEIIQSHLAVVNKQKKAKEAHLPRSTLYNSFKSKNPTIRTLAKMVHCV